MRSRGTLTRWNDDRGFGFITPAQASGDLFVHISAFPRDGVRPQVGELISFEVEKGSDGKSRAVRVIRPRRPGAVSVARRSTGANHARNRRAGLPGLLVLVGLGVLGYWYYLRQEAPAAASAPEPLASLPEQPSSYSCDGRTRCPQMRSCEEATYFIRHCPNTEMDGDNDGVPCESQWCN